MKFMKYLCAVLCLLILFPSYVKSAVFINETWDTYANQAAVDAVWPTSCPGNPNILVLSSAFAFSPPNSSRSVMNGAVDSCFHDRDYPFTSTVFYKWDVKFVNFDWCTGPNGSKQLYMKGPTFLFIHIEGCHASYGNANIFSMHIPYNGYFRNCPSSGGLNQGTQPNEECIYAPNINTTPISSNGQYCIEAQATMSTKGGSDGILRLWIDGRLEIERTSVPIVPSWHTGLMHFMNVTEYAQAGYGTRYMDNLVIGDTRIGCSGSPPPGDTTPPAQVQGLQVSP